MQAWEDDPHTLARSITSAILSFKVPHPRYLDVVDFDEQMVSDYPAGQFWC
jgi:hypothetical protein